MQGGRRSTAFIKKARRAQRAGVDKVTIGFHENKRYPDGTPVATVARILQFGSPEHRIREHPYFRIALQIAHREVSSLLRRRIDTRTMTVNVKVAASAAEVIANAIRDQIRAFRLIDTGTLLRAVGIEIDQ